MLDVRPGKTYIDGTVGSAGHASGIVDSVGEGGFLLGIDRDAEAVERAKARLPAGARHCRIVHGNFSDMARHAGEAGLSEVDGVLLDVGVSSDQLAAPARGFSFDRDGPLDMRMDTTRGETAAELVARLSEQELAEVLRTYGEERRARSIARAIVSARRRGPIRSTLELAGIVESAAGGRRGRLHPATRTFQALRIAVNRELESLEVGLEAGLGLLAEGGRMAVISFHSLEDRIVKHTFREHAGRWESLPAGGRTWQGREPRVRLLSKKPVRPSEAEIARNPRARSAKLRVAERCAPAAADGR